MTMPDSQRCPLKLCPIMFKLYINFYIFADKLIIFMIVVSLHKRLAHFLIYQIKVSRVTLLNGDWHLCMKVEIMQIGPLIVNS